MYILLAIAADRRVAVDITYVVLGSNGFSAGLMPTEARGGNYFSEPPYLRETKTYHSQPLESTRHAGSYFVPLSIRSILFFFVAEVMSNYLTTGGLKKFSPLPEAHLRPEARGICHICHMVNPALNSLGL